MESQNEQNKRSMLVQVEQLKETIADRDRILRETVQEQQNVIAERNTLNEVIQQQQEYVKFSQLFHLFLVCSVTCKIEIGWHRM